MDSNAADPSDNNLIIRPMVNWDEGARYIVALRRLKMADGTKIKAPNAFKVYRDRLITKQKPIEARRDTFEKKVFKPIKKSGTVHRPGLYMAWDFTVASEDSLSSRVLAMRDDAFARLGDTNLADGVVQGSSPDFTITEVNDNPEPGMLREVKGTIEVPCYLDENGCPSGSQFAYDGPDDTEPNWNESFTMEAPFECNIPENVDGGSSVVPARPSLYGHGLLGDREQAGSGYIDDFSKAHNIMHCAVDWAGFATEDVGPVILPSLSDVTNLSKAFDRMQQGFINFLYLGRAIIHADGFSSDPAFRFDAGSGSESVIDTSELYYYGNSQGGIMGGALTAIAPDFEQSVLGVPGMNYSTLLRRSVDFDDYAKLPNAGLYDSYPDEGERVLLLGLMQMLWDRGEANGYAQHMVSDPYPNTPDHDVLMHLALGDHQVANVTAEVEARTIGAEALSAGDAIPVATGSRSRSSRSRSWTRSRARIRRWSTGTAARSASAASTAAAPRWRRSGTSPRARSSATARTRTATRARIRRPRSRCRTGCSPTAPCSARAPAAAPATRTDSQASRRRLERAGDRPSARLRHTRAPMAPG